MAAPAPVPVNLPAGPQTPHNLIYIAANAQLVNSLATIVDFEATPNDAAGQPQVGLPGGVAARLFLPPTRISRVPADYAAARAVNTLSFGLEAAGCWLVAPPHGVHGQQPLRPNLLNPFGLG